MNPTKPAWAAAAVLLAAPACADAATDEATVTSRDIVVTAQRPDSPIHAPIDRTPGTAVTIDAARIATTVNAVNVEDALKYAPSLIIRKRSIGDNFAPIATRTSGLGASARSLVYADGALLSALIGNNNGSASPKWNLVAPEEVASIDVLYGPFSAAYAGNSIGTVVNITTRMPDNLEAQATVLFNRQHHEQYATALDLPTGQASASIGNTFGRLALLLTATHTVSNAQPIGYVTATAAPPGTTGGIATFNRLGAAIRVLGAGDIDHHVEDTIKLRAAYDLADVLRATYTLGLFLDSSPARLDSYLRDASGNPVYPSGFNAALYVRRQQHFSHAAAIDGHGSAFDWKVIGTLYAYAKDAQASPTAALPGAFTGGAGTVQRQDGTGWWTIDAKGAWRSKDQVVSIGGHVDRYKLVTQGYATADWLSSAPGTRSAASLGKTRTAALWVQDAWDFAPAFVLTLGARQEWWRAYAGFNQVTAVDPGGIVQPLRSATGFSPKATLEWKISRAWSLKASFGQAYRFPTVGELYQATTVGSVLANPNPNLRPERARSGELAVQVKDAQGLVRLSVFDEVVDDALIAQTGPLAVVQRGGATVSTIASFVQNVDRTRAWGVELAIDRRDVVPRIDLSGSVTYADAITSRDTVFPAAVGKLLPGVPHWKASAALTWRPTVRAAFTAAARYSSRNYATLDNSDVFADSYQGFDRFFVIDLRATVKLTERIDAALGIDNVNNDRYFLFHPFPQRSVTASLHWKL
jgi:iron complex outermembrane receptor protein